MVFDSAWSGQTKPMQTAQQKKQFSFYSPYIRKAFLISDNDAYNRMYEFLGQQTINRRLHELGYPEIRITRRFMRMTEDENSIPTRCISSQRRITTIHSPWHYNMDSSISVISIKWELRIINANDSLIHEPIDFTTANNLPLKDMQQILQSVLFPQSVPVKKRFYLTKDDLDFLYRFYHNTLLNHYPKYDSKRYYDSYVKFYFRNDSHTMPPLVRVFIK